MNCDEVKELIQLYLDNELDARTTLGLHQHLEVCPACSRLLNALLIQDQALKQAARDETPASSHLRARILDALERQPLPSGSRLRDRISGAISRHTHQRPASWLALALPVWGRAAAATALIAMATLLALYWGRVPGVNEEVYAAVAADHAAHCSVDNLMGAVANPDELNQLAGRYGKLKVAPDLAAFGYGQARGRVCQIHEVEFLHLVYYHATEPPLSVFIRPQAPNLMAEQLRLGDQDNYRVASVSHSGVDLLVVTSLDEQRTSAIARAIAALV